MYFSGNLSTPVLFVVLIHLYYLVVLLNELLQLSLFIFSFSDNHFLLMYQYFFCIIHYLASLHNLLFDLIYSDLYLLSFFQKDVLLLYFHHDMLKLSLYISFFSPNFAQGLWLLVPIITLPFCLKMCIWHIYYYFTTFALWAY